MNLSLHYNVVLCPLPTGISNRHTSDTKYLCSWFSILQIAFFSSFLLSYVACFDGVLKAICEVCFPTINAIAWIVFLVCLSEGQGAAEFLVLRNFTVHVLPAVAASIHEIYISASVDFHPLQSEVGSAQFGKSTVQPCC